MQALIDSCRSNDTPAEIALVISNEPAAPGLAWAAERQVPAKVIHHRDFPDRSTFDTAVDTTLRNTGVQLICLAGFTRILTDKFVEDWRDRMINIHPSLLPDFKGLDTHARALAAGMRRHGCTVHFVRPEMDAGPIIAQAAVPVEPNDTPETLAARVLRAEHRIYPMALRWIAEGRVQVQDERVLLDGAVRESPLVELRG